MSVSVARKASPLTMTSLLCFVTVVCGFLVFVDAENLIYRPHERGLLDNDSVDCSSAFYAESVPQEGQWAAARLGLVHRYGPCSPMRSTMPFESELALTEEMLEHEANRVRYVQSKMDASVWDASKVGAARAPLVAGLSMGTGNYLLKVGLGTPSKDVTVVVDTGSEIMWTQCLPCASSSACYAQTDPLFDPKSSTSYAAVPCGGTACSSLSSSSSGGCVGSVCQYMVNYLDGSFTKGDLSTDTLNVGGTQVNGFQFGCGHDNEGLFKVFAGVMGLDRSPKSLLSQTSSLFGQTFAYCLPSPFTQASGYLELGSTAALSSTRTPMTTGNPFYVAQLTSVTVGSSTLTPNTAYLPLIVDSGTSITRLTTNLYTAVRDSFKAGVAGLTPAPSSAGGGLFDTCFTATTTTISIPKINFNLAGGVTFSPTAQGLLYPAGSGIVCLALAPIQSSGASILGNFQQQGFRFAFDLGSNSMSIDPSAC